LKNILIIYHSQSGIVEKMAYAVKMGVESIDESLQVELKKAQDAGWDDLKMADGIAIGTPDYFDYMAGTVKDFFDRTFYPSQSRIEGSLTANLPCVFFTSGGLGGEPAIESLQKISTAFKFKVIDYVTAGSKLNAEIINSCEELGKKLGTSILEDKKFD
jgi:multimeric flavodoxin WrbA